MHANLGFGDSLEGSTVRKPLTVATP